MSQREHAEHELRDKLHKKNFAPEHIDCVVAECVEENWLSDERYCQSYVKSRYERGIGPVRIRMDLAELAVDPLFIDVNLKLYDWFALAKQVRANKFNQDIPQDYVGRAKQQRFLQYRGFDGEQINAAVCEQLSA